MSTFDGPLSTLKSDPDGAVTRKRSSTGDETAGRSHRKQAKSDVIRQLATADSPESRDSSDDDDDVNSASSPR